MQSTAKDNVICLECGISFAQKNYHHKFHNRSCYMKYYRKKKHVVKDFPVYKCNNCYSELKLNFDPRVAFNKWKDFCCPICGDSVNLESRLMAEMLDDIEQKDNDELFFG